MAWPFYAKLRTAFSAGVSSILSSFLGLPLLFLLFAAIPKTAQRKLHKNVSFQVLYSCWNLSRWPPFCPGSPGQSRTNLVPWPAAILRPRRSCESDLVTTKSRKVFGRKMFVNKSLIFFLLPVIFCTSHGKNRWRVERKNHISDIPERSQKYLPVTKLDS